MENVSCLKEFIHENNMNIVTKYLDDEGEYTYHNDTLGIYSMIDHCLLSQSLSNMAYVVDIVDDVDDWSDHRPIVVTLNCNIDFKLVNDCKKSVIAHWDNESNKIYYERTRLGLYNINIKECEVQGMCSDSDHCKLIDHYCNDIINILHQSTDWKVRNTVKNVDNNKLIWNRHIRDFKNDAKRNFIVWKNKGRIRSGIEYECMIESRRLYKKEVKKAKFKQRENRRIQVENLLDQKHV
jgi:hypothetical protein